MKRLWGKVTEVTSQRAGISELLVSVEGREGQARAICYPDLTGQVQVGERVLLNTTALDLKLGTGGAHFVIAAADDAASDTAIDPAAGHLMKLRYTPHQINVLSVEAPESVHHRIMERRDSLEGVPVVCCGLHSQVPLVAAAIKAAVPALTVGYVMDDAGALALPLSQVLADAVAAQLIDVTVSTGQAFGGDIEAINLYSGLLAAVHIGGCDVVIAGIGPGLAGTGTPFGHGGVAQGEAINAVASLGGLPVVCLRMSQADTRERHQGISHHSLTALSRVALAPATIAVPYLTADCPLRACVDEQLDVLPNVVGHQAFQLEESIFDADALRGVSVTTMGRDYAADPLFFEAAAAAGAVAAMMAVATMQAQAEDAQASAAAASTAVESAVGESDHVCVGKSCANPCAEAMTKPEERRNA